MIEIQTLNSEKYFLSVEQFEKIKELVEGIDPFDLQIIINRIVEGKYLLTPEKAYLQ